MGRADLKQLDITKTSAAVRELLEVTENRRHRYLCLLATTGGVAR